MDLRTNVPRSPYAELSGYVWLARMIDKARATLAGSNGDYHYNCPMDQRFLSFYGISSEALLEVIRGGASDEEIVAYIRANQQARSPEEDRQFKVALLDTPPADPEKLAYLKEYQEAVAPGRTDLDTFAKVIATEEKHPIPVAH